MMAVLRSAALAVLVLLPAQSWSADKPSPEQVKAITLQAAEFVATQGIDAARVAFDNDGKFKFGEVYVNVIDSNGTWLVYPPNPKNEGKSVLNIKDADGKLLVREIIRVATEQNEGWIEYRWLNPVSNKIEPKLTFVKQVPQTGLITYVGVYR